MPDSASDLIATSVRKARRGNETRRPLYHSRVPAGFPSPADDNMEISLDSSEYLIGKEEATFFVRVAGDSMTEAGVHDGDIVAVDVSVEPEDGSVVVAPLDGELTVKRSDRTDEDPPQSRRS